MKRIIFATFALLLNFLSVNETFAQELTFSKENFTDGKITLPYRKATIPGLGNNTSLVIYLHGGSSKGNDNETQMQEPGINAISSWLVNNSRKAIMLVPQCPSNLSWLGTMQDVIVHLLQSYIDRGVVDANKVYIFGGSMGGTGTWNMLSNHPDFFAAAMPVAGNPTGLNAEAISKTPLYIVMGTADKIMKISNVEIFLNDMDTYNAAYMFDIENGWTHEDVCKNSYTDKRLNWVFKNTKQTETSATSVADTKAKIANVAWYAISGEKLASAPKQKGIYIKQTIYCNGLYTSEKSIIN